MTQGQAKKDMLLHCIWSLETRVSKMKDEPLIAYWMNGMDDRYVVPMDDTTRKIMACQQLIDEFSRRTK